MFKGVFFVVGSGITEKTRKNLVKVIQMGNEIGNHSYSHLNFAKLDIQSAKEEIFKTDPLITSLYQEAHVEQKKKYLRYPFGKQPPASYKGDFDKFLDSLGYADSPMFRRMDVDLRDRRREPSDQKIEKIKKNDTILLHEKPRTVQTIKKIVQNLDKKNKI